MHSVVLDSSAVLACILKEPGGERVHALLQALDRGQDVRAALSSVTWCEILTRLYRENSEMTPEALTTLLSGVELVPLDKSGAERAADFSLANPNLSLGDRACLALASSRRARAWTTDKVWAHCKAAVEIEILR